MAFPTVRSGAVAGNSGGNVTTQAITLPTFSTGERVIILVSNDGADVSVSVTTPASGWTTLFGPLDSNTSVHAGGLNGFYRDMQAGDASSITITLGASESCSWVGYTITGGTFATGTAPAVATNEPSSSSTTPDPPNLDPAGWAAEDTLWIATYGWDGNIAHSAYPTNYGSNQQTSRWANTGGQGIAAATRELNASAEDPGTGTIASSEQWSAATIAIRPASGTLYTQDLTGGLSFIGAFTKTGQKALTGGLSFTGAFTKTGQKALAGTLSFGGALTKKTLKSLTGVLSFSGALTPSHLFSVLLSGTLSFSGALTKQTGKSLAGALSFSGALTKQTGKALIGALSFAGSVAKQASKVLSGGLSFTGSVSKQASKVLSGGLSFTGSLTKQTLKVLAGALSFVGSHTPTHIPGAGTLFFKELTGSLSFSGSLASSKIRAFIGDALNFAPAAVRRWPWNRHGLKKRRR